MNTCYAPPERADTATLTDEIRLLADNPVMKGLLQAVSGMIAVVNEQRQVVALNHSLLSTFGIDDPKAVLGLRPGEVLSCVHAEDGPAGCGTTKYCSTCGAAVAMVTSFETDSCSERLCALKTGGNGAPSETALMVRSQPIRIGQQRFLLLFLQDVTRQEFRASLERTFFHDIRNTLQIMTGMSELLMEERPSDDMLTFKRAAKRLISEVALQQRLIDGVNADYQAARDHTDGTALLRKCRDELAKHPAASGKSIVVTTHDGDVNIVTDRAVLLRILSNMIINALEATTGGGTVRLALERTESAIVFTVWNEGVIPPDIAQRIFQRHFSTKNQPGRGIGTYSMKLFGEQYLGGSVRFSSSVEEGTVFRLSLPV